MGVQSTFETLPRVAEAFLKMTSRIEKRARASQRFCAGGLPRIEILDIHQFLPAQHHHIIPDLQNEPRCSYTIFAGACSRAQRLCFTSLPAAEHIIETAVEKTIRLNIDSEPDTAETCLADTGKCS